MRKPLTEYYSQIGNDPERAQIWAELEANYTERRGASFEVTPPEGKDLISVFSFDEMQQ